MYKRTAQKIEGLFDEESQQVHQPTRFLAVGLRVLRIQKMDIQSEVLPADCQGQIGNAPTLSQFGECVVLQDNTGHLL